MITLYSKDFTTKYGAISSLCEAFVEEERNGLFELSFIMLNTDSLFNYVKEENIVVVNANDTLLNQKFRIYMTRKLMNNRVEVYARHISFDLMYDYIDNVTYTNQSCEYVLNQLFRNSNFSKHYKGYSDIINAQNYSMSMANVLEAIGGKEGSIIDTFGTGAEILRDNENISILNKRGYDNEVTIEYKKNLTGFELEEDTTDLVTRILPYAKYNDNETNGEIIVKADYVDSPLIANYSHPYIASIDYSDKFEDDEIPTISKLQELARKEYRDNKVDISKQNFKIEFIPLSKCVGYEGLEDKISLCDIVTIVDTRYNIKTQSKVIKTVFNVLKNRYESMELGDPKTSLGDIVGNGNNEPIVGPPGPQGPPGADGNIGDFPNSLPSTPIVITTVYGFANIEISWTFENKVYYQYEVYASKEADFTPNTFNLIHQGQTSTFMYQAKPNETWYFKVCCVNTHGERTNFGSAYATTSKVDDLSNYVSNMAIDDALIGTLRLDRGWVGTLRGNYIDAKNLSVTDGNGKRTLDIDSFGNISIDATQVNISSKSVDQIALEKAQNEVDNIRIGGQNLLARTDFDDARGNQIANLPEWKHWGDIDIYTKWSPGSPTGQLRLYATGYNASCGIYQDIYVGKVPKGTQLVISYDLTVQSNIDKTYFAIEYLNSSYNKLASISFLDSSGNPKYGYQSHVFTTPTDVDYSFLRVVLASNGAFDSSGNNVIITLKDLMLEKGNKATAWKNSTFDLATKAELKVESDRIVSSVSDNYATKSEVIQTKNDITYKFQNGSYTNLLYNGDFTKNLDNWQRYTSSGTGIYPSWDWWGWDCRIDGEIGQTKFIQQDVLINSRVLDLTLSGYVYISSGDNGNTNPFYYLYTEVVYADGEVGYFSEGVNNFDTWEHIELKMHNLPKHVDRVRVYCYVRDTKKTGYFTKLMLNTGQTAMPYTKSTGEIRTDTTKIDGTGVNVVHSDGSRTNLNSHALDFYDTSNTLYAQVNGGLYKFWYDSNYIGYLGHAKWSGTENRVVGMNSEYGQMSTLASKKASSDNFFQVYLIANGCDQTINGVRYRQGATLITPHIGTRLYLYTNGYYTDTYPSFIVNNNEGHIIVAGDNGVNLGVLVGNNYYDAIRVTEIGSSPYVKIDMWGNVDMHNWNLVNANISKSVSATSTQTYALRTLSNEESYSDPTSSTITDTYGVQSLTNGDVRWSDKQTYFTSEVEEGIYEAYIEIPWWLAQNIELNYHVNITPVNGFYQYYLSERDPYYFIVRSDKDSMGFTFEIVATLLEQNTLNNNASIAGAQYLTSEVNDGEQPDINVPDINVPDSSYK